MINCSTTSQRGLGFVGEESKRMRGGEGDGDLHAAARRGDLTAVQSILASNPLSVNSRDKHSRTPLHLAAWAGHSQVVSYLCKHKADVGAAAMDDMGAIHFASQKGHLEVVRTLLSSGVSFKASTRKGLTALHFAAQASNMELVKFLLKKGASPAVKTKAGKTPRDLSSNKEIRLFLKDCEQSHKEGISTGQEKPDELDPMSSVQDEVEAFKEEATTLERHEARHNENVKRKGEEENGKESSSEPKRARVALNHLLTADDTQGDENF